MAGKPFGHIKRGQMHRDLGKPLDAPITDADVAKERAKGGVFAERANFAASSRAGKFKHHGARGHMARHAQKVLK